MEWESSQLARRKLRAFLIGVINHFRAETRSNITAPQTERVQQISLADPHPFKSHPFKVLDDEAMQRTVESGAPAFSITKKRRPRKVCAFYSFYQMFRRFLV